MSILADLLSTVFERRYKIPFGAEWDGRPVAALADDLIGSRGEGSGLALAAQILDRYAVLEPDQKLAFFTHLARGMCIDPAQVREALEQYEGAPSRSSYRSFMMAAEPKRQEFVRRLNQVTGATARLVAMRDDLLKFIPEHPELAEIDVDFRHLFASWFNRGFLVLMPINWESPALILEKIIEYEAVHAIHSWDDLRRRLQPPDRRCFGFFHPSMPNEPLIFVEVALTKGIPNSIQALLTEERDMIAAEDADTAVFYSISNCQSGLGGISFGNSLIKQVVADLSPELPGLKTFVTLSPIPGLMRWLEETGRIEEASSDEALRRLAAHYLMSAHRPDGLLRDPVARFHLGNGARIHAIHAGADTSDNGLSNSGGVMVNYLYDLPRIAQNHEGFATAQKIAASQEVRGLSRALAKQDNSKPAPAKQEEA